VRIRRALRFAGRQSKLFHDLFDETIVLQDASVGEQQKCLCLHVEDNATSRKLLAFNVARNQSRHLHLLPAVNVTPWMILAAAIRFGVIYRRSIKN
jgi:hypothetical protein